MKSPAWRFTRFSVVGMLGAGLQLFLLSVSTNRFGWPRVTATPVVVEITILHNFIWHERFTWSDRSAKRTGRSSRFGEGPRQIVGRLWRFHAGNGLISLGGNTMLTYCLVERLKAPALPAAIGAILLCSAANFLVADRWVYAQRKRFSRHGNAPVAAKPLVRSRHGTGL